jgi:hypothetical protein
MGLTIAERYLQAHTVFGGGSFAEFTTHAASIGVCSSTETASPCQQFSAQSPADPLRSLQQNGMQSIANPETQLQLQPWQQPYLQPQQLIHRPSNSSSLSLSQLRSRRSQVNGMNSTAYHQTRSLHLAPPFLVEDYTPAAVTTHRLGRMPAKLHDAAQELANCNACPRDCGVNR